jgi:hypothetical protein
MPGLLQDREVRFDPSPPAELEIHGEVEVVAGGGRRRFQACPAPIPRTCSSFRRAGSRSVFRPGTRTSPGASRVGKYLSASAGVHNPSRSTSGSNLEVGSNAGAATVALLSATNSASLCSTTAPMPSRLAELISKAYPGSNASSTRNFAGARSSVIRPDAADRTAGRRSRARAISAREELKARRRRPTGSSTFRAPTNVTNR